MSRIHMLTVNGQDYLVPYPVKKLRAAILKAVRAGGGYVSIPPQSSGEELEVLISPGTRVSWRSFTVEPKEAQLAPVFPDFDSHK